MEKLKQAFTQFDTYNRNDPRTINWQGEVYPEEYFLALQLHKWVVTLHPEASEALLLASRCQHIGRWEIPRTAYPDGREGYLRWRKELGLYHAARASEIMEQVGYDAATIERVRQIVTKKRIKADPEVQVMENALCLVFLEFLYEDFHPRYPDKIVDILKKSLLKMDAAGHQEALKLPYSATGLRYIQEALKLIDR
jgi:hypothetical protein